MMELSPCLAVALIKTAAFSFADWATTAAGVRLAGARVETNPLARRMVEGGNTPWYFAGQFLFFSAMALGFSYFDHCDIYNSAVNLYFLIIAWNIYNLVILWRNRDRIIKGPAEGDGAD